MPIDSNVLLNEARCLGCGSLSESEMITVALLQRIAEAGGSGGGGTPDLPLNSIQFNEAGAFGGSADLLWRDNLIIDLSVIARANSVPLGITGYSLTGANASSVLNMSGIWNTTGNPVGIRLAITNTASGATAKFLEFLGGAGGATSMFAVTKFGQVQAGDGAAALTVGTPGLSFIGDTTIGFRRSAVAGIGVAVAGGLDIFSWGSIAITLRTGGIINWSSTSDPVAGAINLVLLQDAADILAQRRTTNAQTFRLYRTFTNSTNYERLALQTAAGQMVIAAETAGTGTDNIDLTLTSAGTGIVNVTQGIIRLAAAFTVATLPAAGTQGRMAYVTDALTPTFLTLAVGGGAVVTPVFDNGSSWVTV